MKHINLLIKPASSLCNLRCEYCFYEDAAQNRTQHSMGIMQPVLAKELIKQVFNTVEKGGAVSFAFQGGEPTVAGLPFFQTFIDEVANQKPADVHVSYAIQTNGTLLDEKWARFLKKNAFLVGLSLDGFRGAHDTYRRDADGNGTWSRVLRAKRLLEEYGVTYNALCVVTERCAANPEQAYNSLKNLGFRHIQFIACLDPIGKPRGQEVWSLAPEDYGSFLCRVFDFWYQDWATGNYHSVRLFDDYIHILLGDGASTCATCGKCGAYLVVEADGSVYPCDFFALDEWKLGNICNSSIADLANSERAAQFLHFGTQKPTECTICQYRQICNGGCKNDWFTDETGVHNYHCAAFKMLLDHALPRIHQIALAEFRFLSNRQPSQ